MRVHDPQHEPQVLARRVSRPKRHRSRSGVARKDHDLADWANGRNGCEFMILNTSLKFWPAEYHAQSAIEAALGLRAKITDPAAIEAVEVQSHDAALDII